MPTTQLPPLRPTASPRQSSSDPRGYPAATLVMEEYQPTRDNKKYFFMCLKHLKDIWLRLYALEKKQRGDEQKYSVAIDELKEQTRQLTEEIGWYADNDNENDSSAAIPNSPVEGAQSPPTPCAMCDWVVPSEDSESG